MNCRAVLSVVLVPLLFSACSSKPPFTEVREVFQSERIWSKYPRGVFKIASFEMIRGEGDGRFYTMHYRVDCEVLNDYKVSEGLPITSRRGFHWIEKAGSSLDEVKQGARFYIEDYERFRMTEKGWITD